MLAYSEGFMRSIDSLFFGGINPKMQANEKVGDGLGQENGGEINCHGRVIYTTPIPPFHKGRSFDLKQIATFLANNERGCPKHNSWDEKSNSAKRHYLSSNLSSLSAPLVGLRGMERRLQLSASLRGDCPVKPRDPRVNLSVVKRYALR